MPSQLILPGIAMPSPPPPPPAGVVPPPPNALAPPPPPLVNRVMSPSTPLPTVSPTELIKKQFMDTGETNDFHRLTRAGDIQGLKEMAKKHPELINSRGIH